MNRNLLAQATMSDKSGNIFTNPSNVSNTAAVKCGIYTATAAMADVTHQ
jgi:hypothetical protein